MIVQTAPDGAPRFVIRMSEHTALSDRFADAFGNDSFAPVADPAARFIIANHDAGWADLDNEFRIDPATGYPYNLTETPFELIMGTSKASPDFNETHDPFSGLLSSMHSWGLYNGRYGLSDIVLLDKVAEQNVPAAEKMLGHEETRQARLKKTLQADSETRDKVAEDRLMQAYKQLQFFDTLALYFNRVHEGARVEAVFPHVPMSETEDADITVTPLGDGIYRVAPWPFVGDMLQVLFDGRYMQPEPGSARSTRAADLPVDGQTVTLTAGCPRRQFLFHPFVPAFARPACLRYGPPNGGSSVFAKTIGVVTAVIIFFLYFSWRGTDPVLETMLGILLALLGGAWAWWVTGRRQQRLQWDGLPPADRDPPQ
jgi:hypothetical protein